MRRILLRLLFALALPAVAYCQSSSQPGEVYEIVAIDSSQNLLTLKDHNQFSVLQVPAGAGITLNGSKADLSGLAPKMTIKVTLASPGVAQGIEATGPIAQPSPIPAELQERLNRIREAQGGDTGPPAATPEPYFGAAHPPAGPPPQAGPATGAIPAGSPVARARPTPAPSSGKLSSAFEPPADGEREMEATIPADSPDAYRIDDVRMGSKITFEYVSGKWKSWGHVASDDPDHEVTEGGARCQTAIALASADGKIGQVVALIPPSTKHHGFVFEAKQDYDALVLRINGKPPFSSNPGKVVYHITVQPPQP
jgi:hypothetical protein